MNNGGGEREVHVRREWGVEEGESEKGNGRGGEGNGRGGEGNRRRRRRVERIRERMRRKVDEK